MAWENKRKIQELEEKYLMKLNIDDVDVHKL